ncbi:MAG: hypothetical protein NE327_05500, partial [Lentisphaeraceae bacterium]|nr:hypothetical protein [Lentisphaeraceae bacterium]
MRLFLLLLFLSISTYAEKRFIRLASLPALSPDGEELVFSWHGDLWKVSSEGGEASRISSHLGDDTTPQ